MAMPASLEKQCARIIAENIISTKKFPEFSFPPSTDSLVVERIVQKIRKDLHEEMKRVMGSLIAHFIDHDCDVRSVDLYMDSMRTDRDTVLLAMTIASRCKTSLKRKRENEEFEHDGETRDSESEEEGVDYAEEEEEEEQ